MSDLIKVAALVEEAEVIEIVVQSKVQSHPDAACRKECSQPTGPLSIDFLPPDAVCRLEFSQPTVQPSEETHPALLPIDLHHSLISSIRIENLLNLEVW